MTKRTRLPIHITPLIAYIHLIAIALLFSGCGSELSAPTTSRGTAITGRVHGGQQPVVGATIQLYAAGTGGYGSAAAPLLQSTVQSTAGGQFTVGAYTCPSSSTPVYITATGGNPGLADGTNNAALALMAALGSCGNLNSSTFINVNELTTVAAVWSLAPFMSSYANIGSSASNATGLVNAFASANTVVNFTSGTLPGTSLPAGATLPFAEIDSLANILSSCINTTGGTAGDTSPCGTLFAAATVGAAVPTDTIAAALNIARNPAQNIPTLFPLNSGPAPFQPSLTTAPANWLIGISYTGGGVNAPKALAIDAQGDVWLVNSGSNSVSELTNGGAAVSPPTGYTPAGLSAPSALAIDAGGYVWVADSGTNSLSRLTASGGSAGLYTGGGLNFPSSIAIDADGSVWLSNSGNSTVSAFSNSGSPLSPAGYGGAGLSQPQSIAINPR